MPLNTTVGMEKIEEHFAKLSVARRSAATKEPTYLLDIDTSKNVQEESGCIVAVSCSNGSIRLYNKETLSLLRELNKQPGFFNGVKFSHSNPHVFSACTDGTVKCWDMRLSGKTPVQMFKGYPSNVLISFDINCNDHIICAGTEKFGEDAVMIFWDGRMSSQSTGPFRPPLGVYSETHSDDITKVRFHPTDPNILLSGSTDGLMNVFDISIDNEDEALIATCNSGSSVSYVGWAGKKYKEVYCLTHDEGFCWWDLTNLDSDQPIPCLKIPDVRRMIKVQNGNLDYMIGGIYHEKADQLLVVGGSNTGTIHFITSGLSGLKYMKSLEGGHSAIVRSFSWNTQDDSLLTGGEDAQLLLWKPGATERSLAKKDRMKIASSLHKRVKVHSHDSYKSKKKYI
ncbi:WD repeat-containing protein 89 [Gracilinanus agilis]|uniref:WD repeat-containing protein 89 n=1 Tax=Gracilinanus agilis TaxID=191870 RepID=UPI001CFD3301|nr:WD repeat-containing protein 89 [Gracilinanus agilis]XP_044520797.1 WD repeat-containing protein 89 [Gracilinanus agilis]